MPSGAAAELLLVGPAAAEDAAAEPDCNSFVSFEAASLGVDDKEENDVDEDDVAVDDEAEDEVDDREGLTDLACLWSSGPPCGCKESSALSASFPAAVASAVAAASTRLGPPSWEELCMGGSCLLCILCLLLCLLVWAPERL